MKSFFTLALVAVFVALALAAPAKLQIQKNGELIPENWILVFRPEIPSERARAFSNAIGARLFVDRPGFKFAAVVAKESAIKRLAERTDLFMHIEQDQIARIVDEPKKNDSSTFGRQLNPTWGLDRIDQRNLPLDSVYNYKDSAGVNARVYVIDTGILCTHNEFSGGRCILGPNFHDSSSDSTDDNGHGTHCSGTVAGTTYGVAKLANVVGVKVLGRLGSGSISNVAAGVSWAADDSQGRRAVASMSLGGAASAALDLAVENAIADGLAIIAASGNSNADACDYSPARSASLSVNAADNGDRRASFSNFGTCTNIFAPGVDITSAWIGSNTATNTISGTSMACPHVAGACAMLLGDAAYTPAALAQAIINAATSGLIPNPGLGSPNLNLYSVW